MEKYTFQDWLDGEHRLIFRKPLYVLYHYNLISEEDYEKITKCQEEAHDIIVECLFETLIQEFSETYENTPYKADFLENEIKLLQETMNEQADNMNHILSGNKDFYKITGQQYHEIMDDGPVCLSSNESMKLIAGYRYLKWLECFKDNAKPPHKETLKISIRRAVAFCIYILYDSEKYDILDMRQSTIKEIINNDFSDNTGKPLAGVQTTTDTLLGFRANGRPKEKALFIYDEYADGRKGWEKLPENFEEMIKMFPDDYNKALELLERFK